METLLFSDFKTQLDAYVLEKHQELLRERYRECFARYRGNNAETYREYKNAKNREYYHANKAKFNKRRNEQYHKKKERDRVAAMNLGTVEEASI